jgi:hypothetical protein
MEEDEYFPSPFQHFERRFEQRNIQVDRDRLAQALLEQFWGSDLRDENEQVIAIDRVPSLDLDSNAPEA